MPIPPDCQAMNDKVLELRRQLNDLNKQIDDPIPGGPKPPIIDPTFEEERKKLKHEIAALTAQFDKCLQQQPPLPPASTLTFSASTITYNEGGTQRIYVFTLGQDDRNPSVDRVYRLVVNYWDGTQWQWADQGMPFGVELISYPNAITYEENGIRRIYVFVIGNDGRLYVNYWDGVQWRWADQGLPPGVSGLGDPSVITYNEGGVQRIYVFVTGNDGHLYVNYWDGVQWQWADQGRPPGIFRVGLPSAITFNEGGTQFIYTFVKGDNQLYVNYWNGVQWQWADQGHPSNASLKGSPSAITYNEGGVQRIYVFVRGGAQKLYVNYWDGTQWQWADQGQPRLGGAPSISAVTGSPGVITYRENGVQRIYAFVAVKRFETQPESYLYVNYWDGTQWQWAGYDDLAIRRPISDESPSVVSYVENGTERIYAFVVSENSDFPNNWELYVSYWDGTQWQSAKQGTPKNPE